MIELELPSWLQKNVVNKLAKAAQQWWQEIESHLDYPAQQKDHDSCHEKAVPLLGWERRVDRYREETQEQYRERVRHAFANAKDAGSTAGFKRIVERLGVGVVDILERMPGEDWDVIAIVLTNEQEAESGLLMRVIIRDYGRTCRRYRIHTDHLAPVAIQTAEVSHSVMVLEASI